MIRRVRTPEGAKFYGAPIGTPIVKDRSGKLRAIRGELSPTVHPSVTESSTDIGGNPLDLVLDKIEIVGRNVLPERNRKHTGWKRLGVVKNPNGHNAVAIKIDGEDEATIMSEYDFDDEVFQGIVDDLVTVKETLPADLKDLQFGVYIPHGDHLFEDDDGNPDQSIGGYTITGAAMITLNPMMAVNAPLQAEDGWDWGDHPPFYDYLSPRLSTMVHEAGHLVSMQRGTIEGFGEFPVREMTRRTKGEIAGYAATNPQEAYAELYAQYKIGGPGSLPVADAWAREFNWD